MVYDLKEDYGIDSADISYCDFSNLIVIQHIRQILERLGHYVKMIGSPNDFAKEIQSKNHKKFDLIFNFAEGYKSRNRESLVPALCELYNIPYTFSDCHAMDMTLHKHQLLLFADSIGLQIPKGFIYIPDIHDRSYIQQKSEELNLCFPIVSKPNREGTSMGLSFSSSFQELEDNVKKIVDTYQQEVRCDEYIGGHEIAVPILGSGKKSMALGIVEYQNHDGSPIKHYYTEIKAAGNHKTVYQSFGPDIDKAIIDTALLIHRSIPCYDLSRIDLRLNEGTPYLLEVTPLPALNPGSTFEFCAMYHDISPTELYKKIIESAMERWG